MYHKKLKFNVDKTNIPIFLISAFINLKTLKLLKSDFERILVINSVLNI